MKPGAASLAIGIDLGGTNIKAALVDTRTAEAVATLSKPTRDGELIGSTPGFAHTVREIVHELEDRVGQTLRIGLSAPGLASVGGQYIDFMPGRMHGLEKLNWSTFLDRDCRVLNDAHAALLGEVWAGAAKDCRDVFMLTLGTHAGGAIYSGGRLLRGTIGRAGHLGHISVNSHGERDAFNTPGSLGDAIGNQTLSQRSDGRFATTTALLNACAAGDAQAQAVWQTAIHHLAAGIASLINVLDPELIILGGGIAAGAKDLLFSPLQQRLDEFEWRPGGYQVRVMPAELGDRAGCLGAVFHLEQP